MAKIDENDMSGEAARDGREGRHTRAARAALDEFAPSAAEIGDAVAKALARSANAPAPVQKLGDVVRASVRCGYEDIRQERPDGSKFIATIPRKITFSKDETADGREHTIQHGRPIHLKRAAYEARRDQGVVLIAE